MVGTIRSRFSLLGWFIPIGPSNGRAQPIELNMSANAHTCTPQRPSTHAPGQGRIHNLASHRPRVSLNNCILSQTRALPSDCALSQALNHDLTLQGSHKPRRPRSELNTGRHKQLVSHRQVSRCKKLTKAIVRPSVSEPPVHVCFT